VEMSGLVDDD